MLLASSWVTSRSMQNSMTEALSRLVLSTRTVLRIRSVRRRPHGEEVFDSVQLNEDIYIGHRSPRGIRRWRQPASSSHVLTTEKSNRFVFGFGNRRRIRRDRPIAMESPLSAKNGCRSPGPRQPVACKPGGTGWQIQAGSCHLGDKLSHTPIVSPYSSSEYFLPLLSSAIGKARAENPG